MSIDKSSTKTDKEDSLASTELYHSMNEFKADFASIYNQPDPRAYFSTLSQFGYVIPEMACPVLRAVLARLREARGLDGVRAVDLGCSYGINAALLKRGISLYELYKHYTQPERVPADAAAAARQDESLFAKHPPAENLWITGLDVADLAVAYAERMGLVDRGIAADLESAPPSAQVKAELAHTDAIVSTGCVGYVTQTTFGHILDAVEGDTPPWVASFVLRMFPYDDIAETLSDYGLETEKLNGILFPQRRFATREEEASVLSTLHEMKIDTSGLEDRHGFLAELYLSRPREEVVDLPLSELVTADIIPRQALSLNS